MYTRYYHPRIRSIWLWIDHLWLTHLRLCPYPATCHRKSLPWRSKIVLMPGKPTCVHVGQLFLDWYPVVRNSIKKCIIFYCVSVVGAAVSRPGINCLSTYHPSISPVTARELHVYGMSHFNNQGTMYGGGQSSLSFTNGEWRWFDVNWRLARNWRSLHPDTGNGCSESKTWNQSH